MGVLFRLRRGPDLEGQNIQFSEEEFGKIPGSTAAISKLHVAAEAKRFDVVERNRKNGRAGFFFEQGRETPTPVVQEKKPQFGAGKFVAPEFTGYTPPGMGVKVEAEPVVAFQELLELLTCSRSRRHLGLRR